MSLHRLLWDQDGGAIRFRVGLPGRLGWRVFLESESSGSCQRFPVCVPKKDDVFTCIYAYAYIYIYIKGLLYVQYKSLFNIVTTH